MSTTRDRLRARPLDMETRHARVYLEPEVVAFAEDEARTAAANARREALEEVVQALRGLAGANGNTAFSDGARAAIAIVEKKRDASQPAAETQKPADSIAFRQGRTCCTFHATGGAHRAECGGDDASVTERGEQPPARDVDGLAQFLGDYVRKHTTMLNWRDFAIALFAHLDGGPRT